MSLYSKKWWFSTGALAASQRAVVFEKDDNILAAIFSDPGMTIPLANPTTTDATGLLEFYIADGSYWVFVGEPDSGDAVLETVGVSPDNPVLSVNTVAPDIAGNVTITAANVGAQPIATIDARGDLYVGTAADATTRLPVGADGFVLTSDSAQPTGLKWDVPGTAPVTSVNSQTGAVVLTSTDVGAQPISTINAKGDLYVGTANDATTRLPVGTNGQTLVVNSATGTGLQWQTSPAAPVTSVNGQTGAVTLDAADVGAVDPTRNLTAGTGLLGGGNLSADRNFSVLFGTSSGTVTEGDDTRVTGAQQRSTLTTKGDLYAASAPSTVIRLPVGADGQILTADSAQLSGIKWNSPGGGGDVTGPASSVDNQLTRFDGVTGKLIQTSTIKADDDGAFVMPPVAITPSYADGHLYYSSANRTLIFDNDDSNAPLPIGQQTRIEAHNHNGFTITKGSAVYVNGGDGSPPFTISVSPSRADDQVTSESIGVALNDMPPSTAGFILVTGLIEGIDTSTFFEGQYVFLSATIAGALTGTPPNQPGYRNVIGVAGHIDAVNGTLYVFPSLNKIGFGNTNQYLAVDTGGVNQMYRTLAGTAGRLTVTHSPTAATFDVDPTLSNSKVDKSTLTAKGSLISATAAATPTNISVGADTQVLRANSVTASGLEWHALTATDVGADPAGAAAAAQAASLQKTANLSDVTSASTSRTNLGLGGAAVLNVGTTAGTVAAGDDSRITGAQQRSDLTVKGDIYVATASATTTRLPVGTNNQFLRSQSATGTGLRWDTITASDVSAVPTTRNVNTSNGIVGGGALSADLSLQPTYGTAANTFAQGNDTRIVNAVQGPPSATDTAITLYNGTTGKLVRNSTVLIDATGTITLPTQASPPTNPGQFNSQGSNLFFTYNDPNQAQVSLGQQVFMLVNNNSGLNIAAGSCAYITGVTGSKAFVSAARANALATSKVAGIAIGRIDAGNDGYLLCQGVGTTDTTGMAVNDTLYLSTAVGGALTNTSPVSPDFSVKVGTVASVGALGKVNIYIELPVNGIGTNGQVNLANSTASLGNQWVNNLSGGINPSGGLVIPAGGVEVARTSGVAALNLMYLLPVSVLRAGTLSSILIEVTGATVGSVMRAGVYGSNSSNQPTGTPLIDFGTIATATAGVKLWSPISFAMSPGVLYYIALVSQTAAPNVRLFSGSNPYVPTSPFPAGAGGVWSVAWTQAGVSGLFPPIGSLGSANAPVTGLLF